MSDEVMRLRLVGDARTVARALASGRFELVDGAPGSHVDAELVVRPPEQDRTISLTPRERDVLRELGRGASNQEIAQRLYIADNTVKNHVRSILLKLDAQSRTHAVVVAHRRGVMPL